MVGFRITINGNTYCESDDISALTMVAEVVARRTGYRISLHAGSGDAPVQWLAADLKIGDEIVIRVVDLAEAEETSPLGCSFCGREVPDVSTLVQGPAAAICDDCIRSFRTALRNATQLPVGASIRGDSEWRCGFCSNQPTNGGGLVVRNGAAVCPECLRACSDILDESANKS
jgi:hypothetical protein